MAPARKPEDDVLSYCSSYGGETLMSRRSMNTWNAKQRSVDTIAKKLRDHSFDVNQTSIRTPDNQVLVGRKHFNEIFHGFRFMVVMFGGFSLGLMLLSRYNITVAILKMVNQTALYIHENPDRTIDDFLAEGYSSGGEFDWDNEIQQMIMSWYMFAYALPQIPATKIGLMIGSRWAIFISLLTCAVATFLTPIAAYWGWEWVIALRLLNGIGASAILPMMLNLIENWMPHSEISLGLTCAQLLKTITSTANPLVIGYLCSINWSYAFYGPAVVMFAFCALWMILITDRPDDNWFISKTELDYIRGASCPSESIEGDKQESVANDHVKSLESADDHPKPTALDILKVPSFYAYLFMWCFDCSAFTVFTFILPTYLRQFLKIEVSQNGLFCFIIQTGALLCVTWPHPFLRLMDSKFKISQTAAYRITYCVICFMVASTWIYVGAFHELQLPLLFINRCFHGSNDIVVIGILMSNYGPAGLSSMAFSMVNTAGNLSVVFLSTFIGWLLDYTGQSRQGWSWIYLSLGASQLILLVTFTTLIRPGPINFNKSSKKNNRGDPEVGKANLEVICKKESPVQLIDKLDKIGDSKDREDRKAQT